MHLVASWCILVHFGESWCILVHLGASWCNLVHLGASWCILVHHGASWCILVYDRDNFLKILYIYFSVFLFSGSRFGSRNCSPCRSSCGSPNRFILDQPKKVKNFITRQCLPFSLGTINVLCNQIERGRKCLKR